MKIEHDPAGSRDDFWGGVVYDSDVRPAIVTNAPSEVRERLPEAFKEKFPLPK